MTRRMTQHACWARASACRPRRPPRASYKARYVVGVTVLPPTSYRVSLHTRTAPIMAHRAWVFTHNNPAYPTADLPELPYERYVSWQREVGESGTPHIQGYVECSRPVRLAALRAALEGAHFEPRRGTREQARDYTVKVDSRDQDVEGDPPGPFTRGDFATGGAGKRNDIRDARDAILAGAKRREILNDFPDIVAKFPRFIETCEAARAEEQRERLDDFEPREWQKPVLAMLAEPPSKRQILWIYDAVGDTGKTYLSRYLVDQRDAWYCCGGKTVDLTYSYAGQDIVIFDYSRDTANYVNYQVMEQMKNGMLHNTKYQAAMKIFNPPHLICFANFLPEAGKFSRDRLVCIELIKRNGDIDYIQRPDIV